MLKSDSSSLMSALNQLCSTGIPKGFGGTREQTGRTFVYNRNTANRRKTVRRLHRKENIRETSHLNQDAASNWEGKSDPLLPIAEKLQGATHESHSA
jgi:hypothetical protein